MRQGVVKTLFRTDDSLTLFLERTRVSASVIFIKHNKFYDILTKNSMIFLTTNEIKVKHCVLHRQLAATLYPESCSPKTPQAWRQMQRRPGKLFHRLYVWMRQLSPSLHRPLSITQAMLAWATLQNQTETLNHIILNQVWKHVQIKYT